MNAVIFCLAWFMSLGTPASAGADGSAAAAEAAPPKIKLTISAQEELKTAIYGSIVAQLQSHGPVQWVEDDPDWTIGIVTTQLTDANGVTAAVGLSFVVEQHGVHMKMMLALAQACRYFLATGLLKDAPLEQSMNALLRKVDAIPKPPSLSIVSEHKMCVVTPDRLGQACRDIVLAFQAARLGTPQNAQPNAPAVAAAPGAGK